jgi:hypothetical protein
VRGESKKNFPENGGEDACRSFVCVTDDDGVLTDQGQEMEYFSSGEAGGGENESFAHLIPIQHGREKTLKTMLRLST